jgi:hypothetical protein
MSEECKSNYRRNKRNLPVGYKKCPTCGGTGQVPCHGKEYHQAMSHAWAKSLHGRAVMVPFFVGRDGEKDVWTEAPGLAVYAVNPGGWGKVRVYISIDKSPNWGHFNMQLYGYDDDHDVINDHKLYYLDKGWGSRKDVVPLIDVSGEVEKLIGRIDKLLPVGQNKGNGAERD